MYGFINYLILMNLLRISVFNRENLHNISNNNPAIKYI